MSTDQTPDSQISLTLDRYGDVGKLVVDGVDMSHHVGPGFTLAREGRGIPTLTVALLARVSYDGPAVLRVDDEAAAMLARHGWTPPQEPTTLTDVSGDEPVTDEPAVGEQVTDRDGYVWQRFEGGWRWWRRKVGRWSDYPRTWAYVQTADGPLRATTDDDRRRVGLPVHDENASLEPVEAAESDAQPEDVSEDPEAENGPENAVQGRIGWLRVRPYDKHRHAAREIPGGWTDIDIEDDRPWLAEHWPDAEFTPIRTLADDEVAVKREDLRRVLAAAEIIEAFGSSSPTATRLRAVLEAGR